MCFVSDHNFFLHFLGVMTCLCSSKTGGCAFNNNDIALWSVTHHLIIYRLFRQSNCSIYFVTGAEGMFHFN